MYLDLNNDLWKIYYHRFMEYFVNCKKINEFFNGHFTIGIIRNIDRIFNKSLSNFKLIKTYPFCSSDVLLIINENGKEKFSINIDDGNY